MHPFLVVVHNLKPASSNMLDLGSKYLIRTLNYAPYRNTIFRLPLLFFAKQNFISRSPSYLLSSYYNNFCSQVLNNGCEKHWYYVCYNSSKWQYSLVHFRNWVNGINLCILSAFSRNSRSTIFFLLTNYCDKFQIHTSSAECRTDLAYELCAANSPS